MSRPVLWVIILLLLKVGAVLGPAYRIVNFVKYVVIMSKYKKVTLGVVFSDGSNNFFLYLNSYLS